MTFAGPDFFCSWLESMFLLSPGNLCCSLGSCKQSPLYVPPMLEQIPLVLSLFLHQMVSSSRAGALLYSPSTLSEPNPRGRPPRVLVQ